MSPAIFCAGAVLWALSILAARCARVRLRVWFYSALEYTQAFLLEKSARFPFPIPLSPALWLGGYFERDRRRLLWAHLGGLAVPVLSLLLFIFFKPAFALAGTAVLVLLQSFPLVLQLLSRPFGADGKRHERFNRYAPLSVNDRHAAALEMKKTRITALGQRFFPQKAAQIPSGANTVRDEGLIQRLSSY